MLQILNVSVMCQFSYLTEFAKMWLKKFQVRNNLTCKSNGKKVKSH